MAQNYINNLIHIQTDLEYRQTLSKLLLEMERLGENVKQIQSNCQHVFYETSTSNIRGCIKCYYSEVVKVRFPE
jgi:hypothetical protein